MVNDISGEPGFDAPLMGLIESLLTLTGGGEQAAALSALLGIRITPVVLDANVIIQDIICYLRTKEPTGSCVRQGLDSSDSFAQLRSAPRYWNIFQN
jgi:hypothetical protein